MHFSKFFLILGSLNGALAVLLGAFGAHGLKKSLSPERLNLWHTGVEYHFYHALALLVVGILALHFQETRGLQWAGWSFLIGIVLFSGSLYGLSISGVKILGAITPLGGLAFIIGWALMGISLFKAN